jgi:hypothetical protein
MAGDTCREAAVLFLVFLPLDLVFAIVRGDLSLPTWQIIVTIVGITIGSALLEWIGMALEQWR